MLTRRRFLGYSGTGALALASGCTFPHLNGLPGENVASFNEKRWLADKAGHAKLKNYLLGYPANMNPPPDEFFDWRKQLRATGIGDFTYNNVGNPNKESPILYNTHDFEQELILRFGDSFGFSPGNTWGFLSHSGTDSNMHGMYMGRTLLKGRTGVLPKAYFTREAHYSVQILRDLLGLESVFVKTLPDGGMDPDDLRQQLAVHSSQPALVVATIGTTFKGAIDPLDLIRDALKGHPSYLHLDAALFGGYLPFTSHAEEVSHASQRAMGLTRYDSIAVSCHKFFGFPSPAGLFITTSRQFDEFNELFSQIHSCEYINHVPGTITCSRDAVKPAEFYYFSTAPARGGLAKDAMSILSHASYLMSEMQTHLSHYRPMRMNSLSNTVFFQKPSDRVVKKYSLATMHLDMEGQFQEYAHVVVMPHVNREMLAEFLADLERDTIGRL